MILIGDDLLILRPAKTGTSTVTRGIEELRDERCRRAVGGIKNAKHAPLDKYPDVTNFPGTSLRDIEVVMMGRRPENRALSLCKFALLHKHKGVEQFAYPNKCILEGPFFDFDEMVQHIPWWWLYAGSLKRYLKSEEQPRKWHFFRLEDELHKLADLIEERIGKRPVFGHENIGRTKLHEERLTPEARAKLLREWGDFDWTQWGYARP